jgi:predicted dithiol-disulfide oxidoreductase (DUF899 family)
MELTVKPKVVPVREWQRARDELMVAEKEATRALDALAARRRRLPMIKFEGEYRFDTPTGRKTLPELFEGRRQLVVYQFMYKGPNDFCPGCTNFVNNIPAIGPADLTSRGVTFVVVTDHPLAEIEAYRARKGWTVPFASSHGTTFADDCQVGAGFRLSVFLREGDDIYWTYYTTSRGVDRMLWDYSILDLTPFGRQESWESQ